MVQDCIELQPVLFLSANWTLVGTTELVSVVIIVIYYLLFIIYYLY